METNPYESPRVARPTGPVQVVKRSVGLATLLLLTPPAMAIAVFSCCTVTRVFSLPPWISFLVPFAILTALMWIGAMLAGPGKIDPTSRREHVSLFVATPIFVGLATALGYLLAAGAYSALSRPGQGGPDCAGEWVVIVLFWLPQTVALLLMLGLA